MHRTHTCGELNATHIGQTVTLSWWVNKHRELWWLTFIDLRDRYGITQITVNPANVSPDIVAAADSLRPEYCIKVTGAVIARPDNMKNKNMATGEVELIASSIEILTKAPDVLPFPITDETNASEHDRFKHRYLDMRRKPVLDNVLFRAKMNQFARNWFEKQGFVEVQTPIFTVSSPEWARDYLIPSRVNPGQFYALPQSPQQYKQLLMMGGLDKYFQIAPCFRDEDPRADRHSCEFYQFDVEMSFVEQEDIYKVVQWFVTDFVTNLTPNKKIKVHFERIAYHTAIDMYGSDKPDLRFGMPFVEMTQDFASSGFSVFADTVKNGWTIKAMKVDRVLTRKEIDALTETAKQAGAKGLAYITFAAEANGGIAKFFSEAELQNIQTKTQATTDNTVVFIADTYKVVTKSLDVVRRAIRDMFQLVDKDELAFCFIEDFPFFEETDEGLDFAHNPFSFVKGGMTALTTQKPLELETTQYDLVCNGFEIMSGSIRNHDPEVMLKVFEMAGLWEQQIKDKFGAMYEAFQYSPPPHGGFAIGCDRFMMILKDEENIRECYAFPKSGRAQDVLMNAPGSVDEKQLDELHIVVKNDD
jgi:aspartyl-tRNA synthetase